jgi:hypothetical protein
MSEPSDDVTTSGVTGPGEVGARFSEWRCTNCGHGHPKNNPPCDRCGTMQFELVETDPEEFVNASGVTYGELIGENRFLVGIVVLLLAVGGLAALAGAGVFVLSDPVGLGYRYGAVEAVEPNDDGQLTAGEFHSLVATDTEVQSVSWSGRTLTLSYATEAASNDVLRAEVGDIAVQYAGYVDRGGDAARLRVEAVREDGRSGSVTVEDSEAQRYADGELSRTAYVNAVLAER